jgi:hypothetical protein
MRLALGGQLVKLFCVREYFVESAGRRAEKHKCANKNLPFSGEM